MELSDSGEDRKLFISVSFEKAKVCSQSRKTKKASRGLKTGFFGIRFIETLPKEVVELGTLGNLRKQQEKEGNSILGKSGKLETLGVLKRRSSENLRSIVSQTD